MQLSGFPEFDLSSIDRPTIGVYESSPARPVEGARRIAQLRRDVSRGRGTRYRVEIGGLIHADCRSIPLALEVVRAHYKTRPEKVDLSAIEQEDSNNGPA